MDDQNTYAKFIIPEDGKEELKIGDLVFEFVEPGCSAKMYFSMVVSLLANAKNVEQRDVEELLYDDLPLAQGAVELTVSLQNICNKGIPEGEVLYKDGLTVYPDPTNFGSRGLNRNLEFSGRVTVKSGWLGIDGVFKHRFDKSPGWSIRCSKKIATDQLVWTQYSYTLEETDGMDPELVTSVYMDDYKGAEFPVRVFDYKGMTHLILRNAKSNKESITEIPEAIGGLLELRELTIKNTAIKQLPDSLLQLPKLRLLNLDNGQLSHISEVIDLPLLASASFSNNQLTTLPESLALQPCLGSLDLNGNPWQSLPEVFDNNKCVTLSLKDKKRLFNYEYQGADGKGVGAWDDAAFFAVPDAERHKMLLRAIDNTVLEEHTSALEKLALASVCINTTHADDYSSLGNSRFGGLPDLPIGTNYPLFSARWGEVSDYHYLFLAQLNCEELAPFQSYLPRKGILYFYVKDEQEFDCRVVHCEDSTQLQSAQAIDATTLQLMDLDQPYKPFRVEITAMVGLPDFYHDDYWYELAGAPELKAVEGAEICNPAAPVIEKSNYFTDSLGKKGIYREHNNCYYESEHHSINDYVFTQNESPQEMVAADYKGNPQDWVVLLKITSDQNCGFNFFDAGEIFFVIHKSDLAKGDFSNVITGIESS